MNGNQNSTISNIIFHKESLDFETESWEVLNTVSEAAFATGYSSTNVTTGFLFDNSSIASNPLNFTELNLTIVYFKSKLLCFMT